eukprot:745223-Amphidinium_carterae.1
MTFLHGEQDLQRTLPMTAFMFIDLGTVGVLRPAAWCVHVNVPEETGEIRVAKSPRPFDTISKVPALSLDSTWPTPGTSESS